MRHRSAGSEKGEAALKVIAVGGVLVFLLLFLFSYGLKQRLVQRNEAERTDDVSALSPFDGSRAFHDLETIVEIGARPAGSKNAAAVRAFIKAELGRAGIEVEEQAFEAQTPGGAVPMVNLIATVPGPRREVILFGGHYDTQVIEGVNFVGANDGASEAAWLLEMARALAQRAKTGGDDALVRTVMFAWLDGRDAPGTSGEQPGLYGSRALTKHLRERGDLKRVQAAFIVASIGDGYLNVHRDEQAPGWLAGIIQGRAQALEHGAHFSRIPRDTKGDHVIFHDAGIPAVRVADLVYGGAMADHTRNWHTEKDQANLVRAGSLQVVGDVLYYALGEVDAHLDRRNPKARKQRDN